MLGIIADDLTGATDAASAVLRSGLRVALTFGPPQAKDLLEVADADVVVAALKIRSIPAAEAVTTVRRALAAFDAAGVRCVYYKYCSTFDSTPRGNIGPVADELLTTLGGAAFLHVPGYPDNGRTVYSGHLFVDGVRLDESPMRHHPLNAMTDSHLGRVLAPQTPHRIATLPHAVLHAGSAAAGPALRRIVADGVPVHVIADTVTNDDLDTLGQLSGEGVLVGGGAPMAATVCRRLVETPTAASPAGVQGAPSDGYEVVIAGSASAATARQIAAFPHPAIRLPVSELADPATPDRVLAWARTRWEDGPVLVAAAERVDAVPTTEPGTGEGPAAELVEHGLAAIAVRLVEGGAGRLVVAGGETSGAVAGALGLTSVHLGAEIATGVPWTFTPAGELAIAFKSGNFGQDDLFTRAFTLLNAGPA